MNAILKMLVHGTVLPALIGTLACAAAGAGKPNIIFIMVDDMGYADLSCYGSKAIATPNIDRLASEGMRFTDAYSGCTVCAPARSTLMTGYHMGHTSVRSNAGGVPLLDSDVTIAEVLKSANYATGGFGKWGIGDIDTEGAAEKQGFDTFLGYYHQIHAHSYYPDYLISNGKKVPLPGNIAYNKANPNERPKGFMPAEFPAGHKLDYSHYRIVEGMHAFIRAHARKDQPFFCYAPWTPPHGAYDIPADDPAVAAVMDKPWPRNAKVIAAMDAMIDRQVGEVLELLAELNIDDKTMVFFCSDNGAAERMEGSLDSSGPFRGRKRDMTEGGLRSPLLARWPGTIPAGAISALPCYFPDFMPTLAEFAGASSRVPAGIDGISIAPTLIGRPLLQQRRSHLYWEWTLYDWSRGDFSTDGPMQAVRRGKWKGIRLRQDKPVNVYDLTRDAREENDVAAAHPLIAAELAALMGLSRTPERPQPEPKMPEGQRFR